MTLWALRLPTSRTTPAPAPHGAFTAAPITLANGPTNIVMETGYDGDNAATWRPTIIVTVPGTALIGTYSGTVTHSVA